MNFTDNYGNVANAIVGPYRVNLMFKETAKRGPEWIVQVEGPSFTIPSASGGQSASLRGVCADDLEHACSIYISVQQEVLRSISALDTTLTDKEEG